MENSPHWSLTHPSDMCRILPMTDTDLITTGQIADEHGVHRTTVDYWERTGKIVPAQVVSGIRLFRRTDVDAFIATRNAEAAS